MNFYEVLGISKEAKSDEIEEAYLSLKKILRNPLATYSILTTEEREELLKEVEKAYNILKDPYLRSLYDEYLKNSLTIPFEEFIKSYEEEEREKILKELLKGGLEFRGQTIKRIREALNIKLDEISERTKISVKVLEAIEKEDKLSLPPKFYLKSFLKQIAKVLNLDTEKVPESYLKNLGEI